MSTDIPGQGHDDDGPVTDAGLGGTPDGTSEAADEPTPGSDNDGAEAGYTPPAGSDDPVSD